MRRLVIGLVMGASLVSATVSAQTTPDRDALLAACRSGADEGPALATCEWVVRTVLAPDPAASPTAYGADLPGAGVTLARDDALVTLVEVDWNAETGRTPEDGSRYVAFRVLYEGTAPGGSYNPLYWSVVDLDGFAYDRALMGGMEPDLQSSNDLPVGRKAQGWVTFEVPQDVTTLEVVESRVLGGDLRWLVSE